VAQNASGIENCFGVGGVPDGILRVAVAISIPTARTGRIVTVATSGYGNHTQ
jgi:hypothetical protein